MMLLAESTANWPDVVGFSVLMVSAAAVAIGLDSDPLSPATFLVIVATVTFFAALAAVMTMCCFVLMCRVGQLRRKLAISDREKDDLLAVVREQADDLRDQDRELQTLLGPGLDPNATLTVADIVGEDADG